MDLGDRMKKYEEASRTSFPRRMPLIIRVDGKAFSKYTSRLPNKPFDRNFISVMESTAIELCVQIQGAQLAYVQSDEISVLVHGYKRLNSDVWYDNQVQKIVSVSAAIAAATFTAKSWRMWQKSPEDIECTDIMPAYFDARAFVLPESEVTNYMHWRQQDTVRNSVQMLTRSLFSHKECHGKNVVQMKEMCIAAGHPWEDLTPTIRKGRCVKKNYCPHSGARMGWKVDTDIPMFSENREYIESLLITEDE